MKPNIHPDYHEITVVLTDGTSYQTRSTWGKAGDTLRLEVDRKSHPAYTGGAQRLVDTGGQLARFNKRFASLGVNSANSLQEAPKAKPAAKPAAK
ncbi:MAG: 50S ribosomal protein L31 [Dongiaceae bacterium]